MSKYAILIKLSGYQRILQGMILITVNHLVETPPLVLIVWPVPTLHTSRVSSLATAFLLNLYVMVILNVQTEKMRTLTSTIVIKNTLKTILWNPMRHTGAIAPFILEWKYTPLLVMIKQNALIDQGGVSEL